MLKSLTTLSLLVATSAALPTRLSKRDDHNAGLTWISKDSGLPKIVLYNTGDGTILAGSPNGRLDTTNYGGPIGGLTPETLIESAREVLDIAQIAVVNVTTGGPGGASSANADPDRFLDISMDAHQRLCSDGSDIVGAVMVHGTNTLADTVFGVDLTLNCSKPFVATGAMRPNSALSADGPSNFYDAVRTAIHPESRDRGAMIALNDHLVSAFYATKTNGNTVSTFVAPDQGYIAQFMSGQPYFFYSPTLPKARNYFDPFKLASPLPKVDVFYGYQGFDADLLYAAAKNGARGIVIMGAGPGALSDAAIKAAEDLHSQGVVTVASFRPYFGLAVPSPQTEKIISSGVLRGENARIQLQLALGAGYDFDGIQKLFEGDVRTAVYNEATTFFNGKVL
ncbi:l-asparaginase [Fusarium flagelliforme]|uniref:asparaginase n=1 Tax=Fusarium flagelliforme TaxID=2675880 RepID=A0A395MHS5_9HYPO|nr:l-asparaginase [Fusarium flagelliforme]